MDARFLAIVAGVLVLLTGPAIIGAFPLSFLAVASMGLVLWVLDALRDD